MKIIKLLILLMMATLLLAIISCAPKPYGRKASEKTNRMHAECPAHLKR